MALTQHKSDRTTITGNDTAPVSREALLHVLSELLFKALEEYPVDATGERSAFVATVYISPHRMLSMSNQVVALGYQVATGEDENYAAHYPIFEAPLALWQKAKSIV